MTPSDTAHDEPPFHPGEQAVQRRAGSRERMQALGPRVIRARMPEQHRALFAKLPFIVLGAADRDGGPWATLLAGEQAGFVGSPDDTHLRIDALPPRDDPLSPLLQPGRSLGLLGIELQTRRRNRANGRIVACDPRGFTLLVTQSFGNCPKYIQRREMLPAALAAQRGSEVRRATRLDAGAAALVRAADTFFIATEAAGDLASGGADVSHRGGRPGFVQVDDDGRTLSWADFAGNQFFNTLGNLALDPRAGLVFADFAGGDLLHIAGRAELLWDGAALQRFAGAERLLRLHVDEVIYRRSAWPLRWQLVEPSPFLHGTAVW